MTSIMNPEFNINEICRTCLMKSSTLVSIFDNNPALNATAYAVEFLTNFCKVSLNSDNNLPSKVCPLCAEEIKRSYAFKIKCERSAEILKRYAEQLNTKANSRKRRKPTQKHIANTIENTSPSHPIVNIVFQNEAAEFSSSSKRTRKKITQLRPTDELVLRLENNINGNSIVSPSDEVVCIDDDDDIQGLNEKTVETNTQTTNEPLPLLISNVMSLLVPEQIDKSESDVLLALEQALENERSDSPVSVILMIEEDNLSENDNKNLTSNAEQCSVSAKLPDDKDVIEIIDDDPPAFTSNNDNEDTFVCHICSTVITGQEKYVEHMRMHKENPTVQSGRALLTTLSSSTSDALLCHICNQMVQGLDNFSEHIKKCKSPGIKITAEKSRHGYRCNDCGEFCADKSALINHVKLKHMSSASLYICGVCSQEFPTSDSLSAHVNMCVCLRYQCKVCGEVFDTQNDCDFHMEQCHNKCKLPLAGTSRLLT